MKSSKSRVAVILALAIMLSLTTNAMAGGPTYETPQTSEGTIEFVEGSIRVVDPTDPTERPTSPTIPPKATDPDEEDSGKFKYSSSDLSWGTRVVSRNVEQYFTNDPASKFDTSKSEVRPIQPLRKAGIVVVDDSGHTNETWKVTLTASRFMQDGDEVLQGSEFRFKPEIDPWTDPQNLSAAPLFGTTQEVVIGKDGLDQDIKVNMHLPFTWASDSDTNSQPITILTTKDVTAHETQGIANGSWYADWAGYLKVLPNTYDAGSEIATELTWTVVHDAP